MIKTLFSYAFRPFFLLTGCYAALMIGMWGLYQSNIIAWPDSIPAHLRHGHEMLFGFAGSAIAGFLLTAVATWTSRPAVAGPPLIGLSALWIAARIGAFLPGHTGWVVWGWASVIFWLALPALMAREVIAARNTRNYKVLPLLIGFPVLETVFFVSSPDDTERMEACLRAGLFLVIGMISLVGGRIIPAFTQNWLKLNRPLLTTQVVTFGRFDLASILFTAGFAAGFILWPDSRVTGWLGLCAFISQTLRVARWRGWLAWREPLLWVLHIGYAWIPVGFGLLAIAILKSQSPDSGIHTLTYGAIGTLILGVAARVALGHTGRLLQALPLMKAAFGLITLGTISRIFAPLGGELMTVSVLLWVGAYLLFLAQYLPILLTPRA